MITMAKIIGDLIGTYAVQIAGLGGAILVAGGVYDSLTSAAAPVIAVLG